jgi:hypothetical protein
MASRPFTRLPCVKRPVVGLAAPLRSRRGEYALGRPERPARPVWHTGRGYSGAGKAVLDQFSRPTEGGLPLEGESCPGR